MAEYPEFAARERAGWSDDAIVSNYVEKFGPVTDEVGAELVRRFCTPGTRVLDLCTGQGNVAAMAVATGADVIGLDFSDIMLKQAARAAPSATFRQGDAADLPFGGGAFDVVICNFGMMHLPDQPQALKEVFRVLRTGGTFTMATWDAPHRSPAYGLFFGALREMLDMSKAPPQPDLFAFSEPDIAETMIREAGLKMTGHETLTPSWRFDDADGLFDVYRTATVAASMLIETLPEAMVAALRERVSAGVAEQCADGDGYTVPVPVVVVVAERP